MKIKKSILNIRVVNIFTWFTILESTISRRFSEGWLSHPQNIFSNTVIENCIALEVGYVGHGNLGLKLVLKQVQDDEPSRPQHTVVLQCE